MFVSSLPVITLAAIDGTTVGIAVAALIVGAVLAVVAMKVMGGKTISQARQEADRIIESAKKEAETAGKQVELEAQQAMIAKREAFEKETTEIRNELKETERRLTKREDNLDRKLDVLSTKEKHLDQQAEQIEQQKQEIAGKKEELEQVVSEQRDKLLRITNLSEDDARKMLLHQIEQEVQHEAGQLIQKEMEKAEEEARDNSLKITLQAIQRYAAEHTAASTVNAVDIPSDDMKGRVIGREGRNIRAFEQATGVDVIVDDTPGVVVVSRASIRFVEAVAAESLQKLIEDGRIHPTRIEEVVERRSQGSDGADHQIRQGRVHRSPDPGPAPEDR
jgi:ribonuclease Y